MLLVLLRFVTSTMSTTWEQALSQDAGSTWEANCTMDFARA